MRLSRHDDSILIAMRVNDACIEYSWARFDKYRRYRRRYSLGLKSSWQHFTPRADAARGIATNEIGDRRRGSSSHEITTLRSSCIILAIVYRDQLNIAGKRSRHGSSRRAVSARYEARPSLAIVGVRSQAIRRSRAPSSSTNLRRAARDMTTVRRRQAESPIDNVVALMMLLSRREPPTQARRQHERRAPKAGNYDFTASVAG